MAVADAVGIDGTAVDVTVGGEFVGIAGSAIGVGSTVVGIGVGVDVDADVQAVTMTVTEMSAII